MTIEQITQELDSHGLEVVIGLETHIRLNTKTKLFCGCPNTEAESPNQHICPVCTGQMGILPAINKEAVKKSIYFGKAVNATFNEVISWDRKHYEYPDLPKNFQITQFHYPIIKGGQVDCFRDNGTTFSVQLEQVHIEEDAAKLMHEDKISLVDYNKGGVPLIEVVTKPCIFNIKDAATYAQYLQRIVKNLDISEANLEQGQFKSDVSVSLRLKGTTKLNPRTEIKNLNSFKFMIGATIEEVTKQLDYFKTHKTARPDQTTVLWDADLKQTRTMRKKEFDADYRYISEPDLPAVNIAKEIKNTYVQQSLQPFSVEKILIEGGVKPQDAKFFTSDVVRSKLVLKINEKVNNILFVAKTLSNIIKPEQYRQCLEIENLADIINLYYNEKISFVLFQKVINEILKNQAFDYKTYIEKNTVSDEKINTLIKEIIEQNKTVVDDIKAGKKNAGILVGKVMAKIGKMVSGKQIHQKISDILAGKSLTKPQKADKQNDTKAEKIPEKATTEQEFIQEEPIIVKDQYFTHQLSEISINNLNQIVTLCGWVSSVRDHGDLIFVDLRGFCNGIIQLQFSKENFDDLDPYAKLKPETFIAASGPIIMREPDDFNPNLRTGTIELDTQKLEVLNSAKTLPFEIKRSVQSNETIRLKYKFLDHRNSSTKKAIINRHKVLKLIRDFLDNENFIEIETPILSAGTDEGAREFIVPSRKFAGKFYTLPQAPQQFKQMLMVSSYEKYFQIARCFRDEDMRGDRQPEFTQLDIELACRSMQEIIDLNTNLLNTIIKTVYDRKWKLFPFKTLTYHQAMEKYGTDRPDLRYDLSMQDITDILKGTPFKVFSDPIKKGGIVKCIKVQGTLSPKRISKGQIEKLTKIAQDNGLGGLAYIIVNENDLQSPIIKFLGEEIVRNIIKRTNAVVGDIIFFSAADFKTANKALDNVRQELAQMLNLIKPNELHPAWVIDFPLFEETEDGGWTFTHNPFSMPKVKDIEDHIAGKNLDKIIAQQYDLILNGNEIGGGSIRAHKGKILEATFRNMGYNYQEMLKSVGHLYESFKYGAPPHGGIAWGIDRLMMILEKKNSIREVIAFPKTGSGEDLLFNCPSALPAQKIKNANIKSIINKEKK